MISDLSEIEKLVWRWQTNPSSIGSFHCKIMEAMLLASEVEFNRLADLYPEKAAAILLYKDGGFMKIQRKVEGPSLKLVG